MGACTHLGFCDDLLFTRVRVSTVDDADDIRLCTLHQSDRSPEHTLSTTACITVFRLSMRRRRQRTTCRVRHACENSPVRVKETYELLVACIIMGVIEP